MFFGDTSTSDDRHTSNHKSKFLFPNHLKKKEFCCFWGSSRDLGWSYLSSWCRYMIVKLFRGCTMIHSIRMIALAAHHIIRLWQMDSEMHTPLTEGVTCWTFFYIEIMFDPFSSLQGWKMKTDTDINNVVCSLQNHHEHLLPLSQRADLSGHLWIYWLWHQFNNAASCEMIKSGLRHAALEVWSNEYSGCVAPVPPLKEL